MWVLLNVWFQLFSLHEVVLKNKNFDLRIFFYFGFIWIIELLYNSCIIPVISVDATSDSTSESPRLRSKPAFTTTACEACSARTKPFFLNPLWQVGASQFTGNWNYVARSMRLSVVFLALFDSFQTMGRLIANRREKMNVLRISK